jgi:hypothetical protein
MSAFSFVEIREKARCTAALLGAYFDLEPRVFFRESRGESEESFARQIGYYLLHRVFDLAECEIADALGRHHSTIQHGVNLIVRMRDDDEAFEEELVWLGERLEEIAQKGGAYLAALVAMRGRIAPDVVMDDDGVVM